MGLGAGGELEPWSCSRPPHHTPVGRGAMELHSDTWILHTNIHKQIYKFASAIFPVARITSIHSDGVCCALCQPSPGSERCKVWYSVSLTLLFSLVCESYKFLMPFGWFPMSEAHSPKTAVIHCLFWFFFPKGVLNSSHITEALFNNREFIKTLCKSGVLNRN